MFDAAVEVYDSHSEENGTVGPEADRYAAAVIGVASQRVAVTAAARTVAVIRDGLTLEEPSVTLIDRRRSDARSALETALDSGPTAFTGPILGSSYRALRDANDSLQGGDGATALGRFEFARRTCELAPDVVEETQVLLSEAAD